MLSKVYLTLRRSAAVAGPAVIILIISGIALYSFRSASRESKAIFETHDVIAASRAVLTRLLDAETAVRGYVITGREDYLAPYRNARSDVDSLSARLQALAADESTQREAVSQLRTVAVLRFATLEAQIGLRRRAGFEPARAAIMTDRGKELMDSLRTIIGAIDQEENRRRTIRLARRERVIAASMVTIAAGAVIGLALAVLINALLVRAARKQAEQAAELAERNVQLEERETELQAQTEHLQDQALELEAQALALETQATFFDTILENMTEAVLACDSRGVINFANRAARELSSVPVEGRDPSRWSERYKFLTRDGQPLPVDQLPLRLALSGQHVDGFEFVLAPPGGSPVTVSANARPLPRAKGTERGAIVVLRDITAVTEAQERARESDERLRQSQKMEAIGQLAGGIAHDFNNILTAITSYAQLAVESLPEASPAAQDVREIVEAANRASGLTRQLLAFSRRQVFDPRPVDLNSIVIESQALLSRLIRSDVGLVVRTASEPIAIEADPIQIEQVIMNLVINARDAISGPGTITVETSEVVLDAAAADQLSDVRPGQHALLTVSDNGSGMDAETRKHVFEPFFTTKKIGEGTGLGLSTVYGIVRQLNGTIALYTEPGIGTTFKVYIPSAHADVRSRAAARTADELLGTEVVLVVEDDSLIREIIRRVLETAGYRVVEAHHGQEALAVFAQQPTGVDVVITDMVMPVMGGRELAEALHDTGPDVPIVFMSGYTRETLTREKPWAPNVQLLTKPFTTNALLQAVREALDSRT